MRGALGAIAANEKARATEAVATRVVETEVAAAAAMAAGVAHYLLRSVSAWVAARRQALLGQVSADGRAVDHDLPAHCAQAAGLHRATRRDPRWQHLCMKVGEWAPPRT